MLTIAYSSTATVDFSDEELAALLITVRDTNARLQITGALLYRNGRFIQVIEGPEPAVRAVYASIVADSRHRDIHLVADELIAVRRYPVWAMGYQSLGDTPDSEVTSRGNPIGAFSTAAALAEDIRGSNSLFDWLYENWLALKLTSAYSANGADNADAATDGAGTARDPDGVRRFEAANSASADDEPVATKVELGSSVVVTAIFDKIMTDVDSGALMPGDILRDGNIAELLGTSRTPVREALQKLRTIGVVESSANRFTRIAIVGPEKAAQSITVLAALFGAVLEEVIGHVDDRVIAAMHSDRAAFLDSVAAGNPLQIAKFGADFFMRLVAESENRALKNCIFSVVHVVKLAGEHLDQLIGIEAISAAQEKVLAATVAGDLAGAKCGLRMLTATLAATSETLAG